MAGLAHLGVGLAAKRIAPDVPAPVLVTAAYAIDIVWGVCWAAGLEKYATAGVPAPWSHGLFMAVVWSAAAALLTWLITHKSRTTWIIGLLVFSHWVVDFIVKPMTSAFPTDVGVPLLFGGSPVVGLGLYRTAIAQSIGEYGTTLVGAAIYIMTVMKLRKARMAPAVQRAS